MAHIGHISQLLQCFVSYSGMQKAMQWWELRRSTRLTQEAEHIREGLLQELFAMRRQLELTSAADSVEQHSIEQHSVEQHSVEQQWLSQVDRLQQTLEQLGYRLSPPYLEDLPLAIQHLITQWHAEHPAFDVQTHLPLHEFNPATEMSQIVISVLDELLQIAVPAKMSDGAIEVSFRQDCQNELKIIVTYPTDAAFTQIQQPELQYLKQVFQNLTTGQCDYQQQNKTLVWRLCWSVD